MPAETALAVKFGVSRPVIREVVSRLSAEGIVRAERGRGTFVSDQPMARKLDLSPIEDVGDLIAWQDLRIAIEQEAARLAATRCGPDDLDRIRETHRRLIEMAQFGDRAIDVDFEFHLAVARATQNSVLVNAQQSLSDHIRNWMTMMLKTTSRPQSERHEFRHREHQAIIDAIARMDPDAAALAARRHIENGRTRLLTEISAARSDEREIAALKSSQDPKRAVRSDSRREANQ